MTNPNPPNYDLECPHCGITIYSVDTHQGRTLAHLELQIHLEDTCPERDPIGPG